MPFFLENQQQKKSKNFLIIWPHEGVIFMDNLWIFVNFGQKLITEIISITI